MCKCCKPKKEEKCDEKKEEKCEEKKDEKKSCCK